MKVLLIDPPIESFRLRMWPFFWLLNWPPIGERRNSGSGLDGTALGNSWKDIADSVSATQADVIGVTCSGHLSLTGGSSDYLSLSKTLPGAKMRGRRKPLYPDGWTHSLKR